MSEGEMGMPIPSNPETPSTLDIRLPIEGLRRHSASLGARMIAFCAGGTINPNARVALTNNKVDFNLLNAIGNLRLNDSSWKNQPGLERPETMEAWEEQMKEALRNDFKKNSLLRAKYNIQNDNQIDNVLINQAFNDLKGFVSIDEAGQSVNTENVINWFRGISDVNFESSYEEMVRLLSWLPPEYRIAIANTMFCLSNYVNEKDEIIDVQKVTEVSGNLRDDEKKFLEDLFNAIEENEAQNGQGDNNQPLEPGAPAEAKADSSLENIGLPYKAAGAIVGNLQRHTVSETDNTILPGIDRRGQDRLHYVALANGVNVFISADGAGDEGHNAAALIGQLIKDCLDSISQESLNRSAIAEAIKSIDRELSEKYGGRGTVGLGMMFEFPDGKRLMSFNGEGVVGVIRDGKILRLIPPQSFGVDEKGQPIRENGLKTPNLGGGVAINTQFVELSPDDIVILGSDGLDRVIAYLNKHPLDMSKYNSMSELAVELKRLSDQENQKDGPRRDDLSFIVVDKSKK